MQFFSDINECVESSIPCPDSDTICVNTLGAYECVKSSSHSLSQPPIQKNPSNRGKDVSPRPLICSAGYKPANDSEMTCIDVDECSEQLHSCEPDEHCVNEIGSYRYEITRSLRVFKRDKFGLIERHNN